MLYGDAGVTRLWPRGDLDLVTVGDWTRQLRDAVAWPEAALVVVDLRQVSFMDVACATALLEAQQMATRQGKLFTVVHCGGIVGKVLFLLGVVDLRARA